MPLPNGSVGVGPCPNTTVAWLNGSVSANNGSLDKGCAEAAFLEEYANPFDYPVIKWIFISLYGIVFLCSFLGNLLVILVILKHRKMRTITNFFLANLAVADLCVGVFCVLPNLQLNLSPVWVLGKVMCKVYFFVQAMSYTASVNILTVISIERYFAIIYPLRSKNMTSMWILRVTVVLVWLIAGSSGLPFLVFYDTMEMHMFGNGTNYTYCMPVQEFDMRAYSIITFLLWYVIPLGLMTVMYSRISVVLWRTSHDQHMKAGGGLLMKKKKTKKASAAAAALGGAGQSAAARQHNSTNGQYEMVNLSDKESSSCSPSDKKALVSMSDRELTSQTQSDENLLMTDDEKVSGKLSCEKNFSPIVDSNCSDDGDTWNDVETTEVDICNEEDEEWPPSQKTPSPLRVKFSASPSATEGPSTPASKSPSKQPRRNSGTGPNNRVYNNLSHDHKSLLHTVLKSQTSRPAGHGVKTKCVVEKTKMDNALLARRRVIRLLIVVILSFAVCVLPYHIRVLWQNVGEPHVNFWTSLLPAITFVPYYLNSGLNPILYAFLSDRFRECLLEVITCKSYRKTRQQLSFSTKTVNSTV